MECPYCDEYIFDELEDKYSKICKSCFPMKCPHCKKVMQVDAVFDEPTFYTSRKELKNG